MSSAFPWNDDPMTERVIAAIGMARYLPTESASAIALDLGDFHPSAHGGLQLELEVEQDVVRSCIARIGFMHRSTEKLFEARDYRQIMMLANRHDWLSAVSSEIGVALAVEQATGITPPERAVWSRMLLAEAGRIGAIALFVAASGVPTALQLREDWATWQEQATGGRVHPMINRIGGLEHPIPRVALDNVLRICASAEAAHESWIQHFESRTELRGLAALSERDARDFVCSGAVGQASGIDWDIRRDDPYLRYGDIEEDWSAPVRVNGDTQDRYLSLIEQVPISVRIIRRCVEELIPLGDQPWSVSLPKTLRAPEGLVHVRTQNPLGIAGWLLVSDGEPMPLRLKARTPSFAHLQALQSALPGTPVNELSAAVGSFFFVTGDADR
jgi:NADH-quinone oxidoreductase subunit D